MARRKKENQPVSQPVESTTQQTATPPVQPTQTQTTAPVQQPAPTQVAPTPTAQAPTVTPAPQPAAATAQPNNDVVKPQPTTTTTTTTATTQQAPSQQPTQPTVPAQNATTPVQQAAPVGQATQPSNIQQGAQNPQDSGPAPMQMVTERANTQLTQAEQTALHNKMMNDAQQKNDAVDLKSEIEDNYARQKYAGTLNVGDSGTAMQGGKKFTYQVVAKDNDGNVTIKGTNADGSTYKSTLPDWVVQRQLKEIFPNQSVAMVGDNGEAKNADGTTTKLKVTGVQPWGDVTLEKTEADGSTSTEELDPDTYKLLYSDLITNKAPKPALTEAQLQDIGIADVSDATAPRPQSAVDIVRQANGGANAPAVEIKKPVQSLRQMIEELYPVTSKEEQEREEKRLRRNRTIMALGNGLASLSNLYFTTKGAPNQQLTDGTKPYDTELERLRKKWQDEADKHRDAVLWAYNKQRQNEREDREDARADRQLAMMEESHKNDMARFEKDMKAQDVNIAIAQENLAELERQRVLKTSPEYIAQEKALRDAQVKKAQLENDALRAEIRYKNAATAAKAASGGGSKGSKGSKNSNDETYQLIYNNDTYDIPKDKVVQAYNKLLQRGIIHKLPSGIKDYERLPFMIQEIQDYYDNKNDSDPDKDGNTLRWKNPGAAGKKVTEKYERKVQGRMGDSDAIDNILKIGKHAF